MSFPQTPVTKWSLLAGISAAPAAGAAGIVETETESRSDMKSLSRITSMRLAAKIAAMAGVRPGAAPMNVLGGQGLDMDAPGREAV